MCLVYYIPIIINLGTDLSVSYQSINPKYIRLDMNSVYLPEVLVLGREYRLRESCEWIDTHFKEISE